MQSEQPSTPIALELPSSPLQIQGFLIVALVNTFEHSRSCHSERSEESHPRQRDPSLGSRRQLKDPGSKSLYLPKPPSPTSTVKPAPNRHPRPQTVIPAPNPHPRPQPSSPTSTIIPAPNRHTRPQPSSPRKRGPRAPRLSDNTPLTASRHLPYSW